MKSNMRHCWNFVDVWIWGLGQRLEKCWQGAAICDALYLYFFFLYLNVDVMSEPAADENICIMHRDFEGHLTLSFDALTG